MSLPKVGLQLIVYGRRPSEDLPGVLREAKAAGYDGVEAGNLYAQHSPDEVKEMLESTGLEITGCHSGFGDFEDPAKVEASIEFLKGVGAKYLMCSGVGDLSQGLAAYDAAAKVFERTGKICKESGMVFCYHNHAWEFDKTEGKTPIHYLCENTDPDLVKLCIDVYWVYIGGEDPAEFVKRYADRAAYYHFKDGRKGVFSELGRGEVDFDRLWPEVQKTAPEWVVCEQDSTQLEPAEAIQISRDFLKSRLSL